MFRYSLKGVGQVQNLFENILPQRKKGENTEASVATEVTDFISIFFYISLILCGIYSVFSVVKQTCPTPNKPYYISLHQSRFWQ